MSRDQARPDVRCPQQPGRLIGKTGVRDVDEIAAVGRHRDGSEHQRHAIDQQRLGDAVDEALAETQQIEIAVEVAGEADERPPIVVAVTVVDAVEPGLDGVLDRAGQQHDHQRGEQRNHRIAALIGILEEHRPHHLQQDRVDRGDRHDRGGIDQPALDDHLDVHQPVAHDGGGKRERNQADEEGAEFEAAERLEPGDERQHVTEDERQRSQRRSPDDPSQLTPRGHRAHAPQRADHDCEAGHQADGEIDERDALDE